MNFDHAIQKFDNRYAKVKDMKSLVRMNPHYINGSFNNEFKKVTIKNKYGLPNEEYYRQRLLFGLIQCHLYNRDNICAEMPLMSGRIENTHKKHFIYPDIVVFDTKKWLHLYKIYSRNTSHNIDILIKLERHIILVIEVKDTTKRNYTDPGESLQGAIQQMESYVQLSRRNNGVYGGVYDRGDIYLYKQQGNDFTRLYKGVGNRPDRHIDIPSLQHLIKEDTSFQYYTYSSLSPLESSKETHKKLHRILLSIQNNHEHKHGFGLIVQTIATKIYDERIHKLPKNQNKITWFFITPLEYKGDKERYTHKFVDRIKKLFDKAEERFSDIINLDSIDFSSVEQISVIKEIVWQFQGVSFEKSVGSNLYQLVFNQFAEDTIRNNNDEFLTPLNVIDFVVDLINPVRGESICDPTVGTADFLSVAYAKSLKHGEELDDSQIYGMDIDPQVVKLARLNMMLNGDGNSTIIAPTNEPHGNLGSLFYKFSRSDGHILMSLDNVKSSGDWDNKSNLVHDTNRMKKFDIIMTNPPFGQGQPFKPNTNKKKQIADKYELYNLYNSHKSKSYSPIDKGVLFLENMVRSLMPNGRYGIVLSNSIASISHHQEARKWLINHTRIVGIFDLPPNSFADTGVNTTIIIGYKPDNDNILSTNYHVFAQTIHNIGYKVRVKSKTKGMDPIYVLDDKTFKPKINPKTHHPVIREDFTKTLKEFKIWANDQGGVVADKFGGEI